MWQKKKKKNTPFIRGVTRFRFNALRGDACFRAVFCREVTLRAHAVFLFFFLFFQTILPTNSIANVLYVQRRRVVFERYLCVALRSTARPVAYFQMRISILVK